jgi:hypothetical protein
VCEGLSAMRSMPTSASSPRSHRLSPEREPFLSRRSLRLHSMKRVAVLVAGLALFATGFLAACGGKTAESPSSSDAGTATTVVLSDSLMSDTLTLIGENPTP